MFIVDGHLDLAMNAMEWNRDLTLPVTAINERERGLTDKPDRGNAVVSLPELRRGNIGLVVATQIARYVSADNPLPGWHSPSQAWAQTQAQLAWYKAMEAGGEMVQVHNATGLRDHLEKWNKKTDTQKRPVGYILSLEGADSLIDISYVEKAWSNGLRAIGPAHYGPGRYANGTDATGKMGIEGLALLKQMERLNIILDATHLCDDAFWQALGHFNGHVWASHSNVRSIVNHNRQFRNDQIKALINRGAVIGAAMDAWMIVPGWERGISLPAERGVTLNKLIDHIDHICQLAGNCLHVSIGSDLDGGFGTEQCPTNISSIADLQSFPSLLQKRGYSIGDIDNLMHGNILRFLENAWKDK